MSHTPHELHEEFPELVGKITELKQSDQHFARLAEEYHEVNRAVHRAETNVEPVQELVEVEAVGFNPPPFLMRRCQPTL